MAAIEHNNGRNIGAKLMTIGLGTYAFFWQWHDTAENPLTLSGMIDRTADLGVRLFQVCDYPLLESYEPDDLDGLRNHASRRSVQLELGTRGIRPEQLRRYLKIARRLDARMLRTMINTSDHRPSPAEASSVLASAAEAFEDAGVTLALETYEQVPVATLVDIVRTVDSPAVGICVDPANCVAALELPTATVEAVAPYAANIHVKDFAFSRSDGWVGFTLAGCPLGEGLLDYQHLVTTTRAIEGNLSQIIEHWLPWQGDSAITIRTENAWSLHNLNYLRSYAA
jgi:3-oxoisoapionate decarboxylase